MASEFSLHPRLAADTFPVCTLPLCDVQLMNDSRYPWLILVPRRPNLREMHGLPPADRFQLIEEISGCAAALELHTKAEKMNVAALGNQVPQLHIHIIARFSSDDAWPGPVWGIGTAIPYDAPDATATTLEAAINSIKDGRL